MRTKVRTALFPEPVLAQDSSQIGSAFGFTVVGVFVQGLTRLAYSILVGRMLGPAALGDLASVLALASFLVLFWPSAGGNAAGKFIAIARGEKDLGTARATEHFVAVSSAIGGAILGVAACLIVVAQFEAGWFAGMMAGALTLALASYNYSRGLRVGYGHFRATALWDTIASLLSLTLLTGVLVAGWDAALLAPLVIGYAVFATSAWPARSVQKLDAARRGDILRYTAWSSLNIMAAGGLLQLSIVLARQWSGEAELGFYSAAVQLATPASMLSSAMITAMGPSLVTHYAAGDLVSMRRILEKIMNFTVAYFMPMFALGTFWASQVMIIIFGADFIEGAIYLGLLFIAVSATSFNAANARLNGTDPRGIRELATANIVALFVGVGLMAWLGPSIGALGSAIGYLAGAVISATIPFMIVWKRDSMPWLGVLARLLVAYAMMGAALVGQSITEGALWWNALCTVVFLAVWLSLNKAPIGQGLAVAATFAEKRRR